MAVELIKPGDRRAIRLLQSVERKAIERVTYRQSRSNPCLKMNRCGMVMVVISPTTMPAKLVELSDRIGVDATILERVEDRYAVGREGDRPGKEGGLGRDRRRGYNRVERNAPRVLAEVGLRYRHLLLPGLDADHQLVLGQPVRLDIEVLTIEAGPHLRRKSLEGSCGGRPCHLRVLADGQPADERGEQTDQNHYPERPGVHLATRAPAASLLQDP